MSRRRRHDSDDGDLSPPRSSSHRKERRRHDSDRGDSPASNNKSRRNVFDEDLSPPRASKFKSETRGGSSRGMSSPSRDKSTRRDRSPDLHTRQRSSPKRSTPSSNLIRNQDSGKRHGLQRFPPKASDVNHSKKDVFHGMSDEMLGKNATTVYRDRTTGRVRDLKAESDVKIKKDEEAEKMKEEKESKYKSWSKGLKQAEDEKERTEEVLHEMSKPLSRYIDDEDRDEYLKKKELDDDPMLQFMRKKRKKEQIESATAKGEVYFEKPVYQGPEGPPNRFGIRPGHRWDGVDRSNGYEKKIFEKEADRHATREEAYKWSTEDM